MGTTTTPEPDPARTTEPSNARPGEGPAPGRDDRPRLILDTDQLLGEILKRPGQLFVVTSYFDNGTYIEFADKTVIEVQHA